MADNSITITGDPSAIGEDLIKKYMRIKMLDDAGKRAFEYLLPEGEMEKLQKEALKLDIATKKKMLGQDYEEATLSPQQKTLALGLAMRSLPEGEATKIIAASGEKSAKIGENLLEQILQKKIPDLKGLLNVGSGAKFRPKWASFL